MIRRPPRSTQSRSSAASDVYKRQNEDILITVRAENVTTEVLAKLTDDHRAQFAPYVQNESVVLARRYASDGTSKLRVVKAMPIEPRYSTASIDVAFKGKKGKDIGATLLAMYPEVTNAADASSVSTIGAAKDVVQAYIDALPQDQLELQDVALPTGIDTVSYTHLTL